MAFFYETGSVAGSLDDVGRITRSSCGAGLRIVTGSGLVFRADVATGSEGPATTMIIGYPWEVF